MNLRNRTKVFALPLALLVGISFIAASWYVQRVKAVEDPDFFSSRYGFIELVAGQTARLNVVHVSPPPEPDQPPPEPDQPPPDPDSPPPDPDSPPPDPERIRLVFDVYVEDPDYTPNCGGIVPVAPTCLVRYRFLRRELRDVELMPGQSASLNFNAVQGAKVQAFIQALGGPDTRGNPNELGGPDTTPEPHLVPSLEVREGARTLFVVPALAKVFNPQPDIPGLQR